MTDIGNLKTSIDLIKVDIGGKPYQKKFIKQKQLGR